MKMNESTLSTASAAQPPLARIVANVVDMQQQLQTNYAHINRSLESLKAEHQSAILMLREDQRRIDDRAMKMVDELKAAHAHEVERLLDLMKTLLAREAAPAPRPAQQTYNAAASPASFFNQQPDPQMMQQFALQQQRIQQQAIQMHQQQQAILAMQSLNLGGQQQQPNFQAPQMPKQAIVPNVPLPATQVPMPSIPAPVPTVPVPVAAPKPIVPISLPISQPSAPITNSTGLIPMPTTIVPAPVPAVTSPFGSLTQNKPALSFGGFNKPTAPAIPSPLTRTPLLAQPEVQVKAEEEDEEEEYEPNAEFAPVIPLPDLVDVVTGEEGEEVIFEEKSKLYRFAETKEWKERGIGQMKILKNKESGKYRVVMRREQVHKVCANHQLSAGMTIQKMPKNEKAVVWTCIDFSEGEQTMEKFSAKFSNADVADQFVEKFNEGVAISEKTGTPVKDSTPKPTGSAPAPGPAAEKKTETKPAGGFGDQFKLKEGEWDCSGCYIRQAANVTKCAVCGTNKDGTQGEKDVFSQSILPKPAATTQKFSFGCAAASAAKEEIAKTDKPAAGFGSSLLTSNAPKFGGFGGASPAGGIFGGSKTPEVATAAANKAPTFSFAPKKEAVPASSSPVAFSFKGSSESGSTASSPFSSGKLLFGNTSLSKETPKEEKKEEKPTGSTGIFGSGFSKGISFASVAQTSTNIFEGEAAEKAKSQFASLAKSKPLATEKKDTQANDDDDEDAEEDYEPDVDFKPVVPLPDLVEVKTGEEDETIVFKARAKLFRFASETKENKERGTGDIKILKNPTTGKYRAVMRREQTHKLCANFNISPSIKINPKPNLPNVYNFACMDFAENADGSQEIFTIKFKTEEIAKEFYDQFTAAQTSQ